MFGTNRTCNCCLWRDSFDREEIGPQYQQWPFHPLTNSYDAAVPITSWTISGDGAETASINNALVANPWTAWDPAGSDVNDPVNTLHFYNQKFWFELETDGKAFFEYGIHKDKYGQGGTPVRFIFDAENSEIAIVGMYGELDSPYRITYAGPTYNCTIIAGCLWIDDVPVLGMPSESYIGSGTNSVVRMLTFTNLTAPRFVLLSGSYCKIRFFNADRITQLSDAKCGHQCNGPEPYPCHGTGWPLLPESGANEDRSAPSQMQVELGLFQRIFYPDRIRDSLPDVDNRTGVTDCTQCGNLAGMYLLDKFIHPLSSDNCCYKLSGVTPPCAINVDCLVLYCKKIPLIGPGFPIGTEYWLAWYLYFLLEQDFVSVSLDSNSPIVQSGNVWDNESSDLIGGALPLFTGDLFFAQPFAISPHYPAFGSDRSYIENNVLRIPSADPVYGRSPVKYLWSWRGSDNDHFIDFNATYFPAKYARPLPLGPTRYTGGCDLYGPITITPLWT